MYIAPGPSGPPNFPTQEGSNRLASDTDPARALALPGPPGGLHGGPLGSMVRQDPSRIVADDVFWQGAANANAAVVAVVVQHAALDQPIEETIAARLSSQADDEQRVEPPSGTWPISAAEPSLPQHDVPPDEPPDEQADGYRAIPGPSAAPGDQPQDPLTLPVPEPAEVTESAPSPAPNEAVSRLRRWRGALSRAVRSLHLFSGRRRQPNVNSALPSRQEGSPPAALPPEARDGLADDLQPAQPVVPTSDEMTDDARQPPFVEPLHTFEAVTSEEVPAIDSAEETVAAGSEETPLIAEVATDRQAAAKELLGPSAKELLGLDPGEPVFLFAGEMSYAAGIDLLADALITVCQGHQGAQFVFVGDGPLKSAAEAQVAGAGFAHRCRFTGDLPPALFPAILAACDVVMIPARERQDSGLAQRAHALGKPLLTTHQAQIPGVVHGVNGLVVYDCANSLVWGLRELIANPLRLSPQPDSVERQAA